MHIVSTTFDSNIVTVSDPTNVGETITYRSRSFGGKWTYIESIPSARLLLSASYNHDTNEATLDVLHVNKKIRLVNHLYIQKNDCVGELRYNPKLNLAAFFPITNVCCFYLMNCENIELAKRLKWPDYFTGKISSFDFDSIGKNVVSMDYNSKMIISNVISDEILLKHEPFGRSDAWHRCRWNPVPSSPLIACKFDWSKFNIFDAEKSTFVLKDTLDLRCNYVNIWIDWRTDDDLVAIGTESPAIYDHRKGGIIKNLKSTGKGNVASIKWSPDGKSLLAGLQDGKVHLIDFTIDKSFAQATTADSKSANSVCFL